MSVDCAAGKEEDKQSGTCVVGCSGAEVRTDSGACMPLMILASVQSDSKFVEMHKPNDDLKGVPATELVVLQVKPSADYKVEMEYTLYAEDTRTPSWVSFSGLRPSGLDYEKEGELTYTVSGISDGLELNATLVFSGTAVKNGRKTALTPIHLRATIMSTPSFKHSAMTMASEITQGDPFKIDVQAKDSDNQQIVMDRGRFFNISFMSPSKKVHTYSSTFRSGMFSVEPPRADLLEIGEYKVWVSSAFGFEVSHDINASGPLQLPIMKKPLTFNVVESNNMLAVGIGVSVLLLLVLLALLFYLFRYSTRVRKIHANRKLLL